MQFVPYGYQRRAIDFLLEHDRAGLFLDMGLGKTVITLTAVSELMYNRFEASRVLVIAPKRVAESTWAQEAQKWDHLKDLRVSPVLGDVRGRKQALMADADVYVITRDCVRWLVDCYGKSWPFDTVVIDELSSFKNPQSGRFRRLRRALPYISRVIGLTGTPSANSLMDLWAEMYLLDGGARLGRTLTDYRAAYFRPGARNGCIVYRWEPRPGARRVIAGKISDICMSMSAEDYLQLPRRIDNVVPVRLSQSDMETYKTLEREQLVTLGNGAEITALSAGAVMAKLLQMANGRVYDTDGGVQRIHNAKLDRLVELIDTASEPVLVYYSYRHDVDAIRGAVPDAVVLRSADDIGAWNAGRIRVLLAHPASAGYGVNLQDGGRIIIWYGLTWSLEMYQQANARLHRQGQTRPVIVHHLIADGTVDNQVMAALRRKDTSQAALLAALKERGRV